MALSGEDQAWINAQIQALMEHMDERLDAVETRLLTEFHKWASPMEARQRTHSAVLRAVDAEMEALDDRVKKLESGQKTGAIARQPGLLARSNS